MKLTDENLDYEDCRPGKPQTKIAVSDRLRKLLGERAEAQHPPEATPSEGT